MFNQSRQDDAAKRVPFNIHELLGLFSQPTHNSAAAAAAVATGAASANNVAKDQQGTVVVHCRCPARRRALAHNNEAFKVKKTIAGEGTKMNTPPHCIIDAYGGTMPPFAFSTFEPMLSFATQPPQQPQFDFTFNTGECVSRRWS